MKYAEYVTHTMDATMSAKCLSASSRSLYTGGRILSPSGTARDPSGGKKSCCISTKIKAVLSIPGGRRAYHLPKWPRILCMSWCFSASLFCENIVLFVHRQATETCSMAAFGWFALSSCLGTNVRQNRAMNYTPRTGWRDSDSLQGQDWELEALRSSRVH